MIALLAAVLIIAVAAVLLRWIFHPAIISFQKDKDGASSDEFVVQNRRVNDFSTRILSKSEVDMSIIVPAYNEVIVKIYFLLSHLLLGRETSPNA
jgi:hypothetical protein